MGVPVLILGASGFIGRALAAALAADASVTAPCSSDLDLASPTVGDALAQAVSDGAVMIYAARGRGRPGALETLAADLAMALNTARVVARQRLRKCVFFSSLAVYDDHATNLAITEDTPIAPTALYGVGKWTAERVLQRAAQESGTPLLVLRPCMVYGPRDTSEAYGPARFIRSVLRDGTVRIYGDGSDRRDYLFIEDLAWIVARLSLNDCVGVCNLATGRTHSVLEIVEYLERAAGRPIRVIRLERDRPKADQQVIPHRLLDALPGIRFTELAEGLAKTYQAFAAKE